MMLNSTYDSDVDALYLKFVDSRYHTVASTEHYQYDIMLDKNPYGRFTGLEIQSASKLLCKRSITNEPSLCTA